MLSYEMVICEEVSLKLDQLKFIKRRRCSRILYQLSSTF